MTTTRSGIPTTYRYNAMRSRLEARWAAFFDLVGWSWIYEPLDAEGWIPDFLIEGSYPFLVEIGDCYTRPDFEAKAQKTMSSPGYDVLVLGITPVPQIEIEGSGQLAAGWLGEYFDGPRGGELGYGTAVWGWSHGWAQTSREDRTPEAPLGLSVYHELLNYAHRPGPGHELPYPGGDDFSVRLRELWAVAGSRSQWKPPR